MQRTKIALAVLTITGGLALGSISASASVPKSQQFCENDICQILIYCYGAPNSRTGCNKIGEEGSPLCETYDCGDLPEQPEG